MNTKGNSLWFIGALVLLAGLGCSRMPMTERFAQEGILLKGNGPEPQALDAHVTTGTSELNIQLALFEGLLTHHHETLQPVPAVAESWKISADGMRVHFQIRADARWSDGQPVTATDFKHAWVRALSPAQAAPYAAMLYPIAGARDFNEGRNQGTHQLGITVVSEREIEIHLEQPDPVLLQKMLHPVWFPIPSHHPEFANGGRIGAWTTADQFIGNGPFVLKAWRPNQHLEVGRNPYYWDRESVKLNGIRFVAIDEPAAEERAFLGGQLHVTEALPPNRVAHYRARQPELLRVDPYLGTYYLILNTRIDALADPRVRKALSLALDREAIANQLLGGGQRPASGFIPDNLPGYVSMVNAQADAGRARELLAEAGYPDGAGFPELDYLFNSSESHRKIAEAIQDRWRTVLGIQIRLTNVEWRTYLQRRSSADFQIARAVWIADYADPASFLELWASNSPQNWAGWSSPDFDQAFIRAAATTDVPERLAQFAEVESLLIAAQPIIPLYFYVSTFLIRPEVKDWSSNLLNWPDYKRVNFSGSMP